MGPQCWKMFLNLGATLSFGSSQSFGRMVVQSDKIGSLRNNGCFSDELVEEPYSFLLHLIFKSLKLTV